RFGVDVRTTEDEGHGVPVPAQRVAAHLESRWWRLTARAGDAHPVGAVRGEGDGVEASHHVWSEVSGRVDLVEQLRRDRLDGDRPAGSRVLGDHAGAVGMDFGDRKPRVADVMLVEEAVVAASRLRTTFEDMTRDRRPPERIPTVPLPAEARCREAANQPRVGAPPGG